MPNIETKTSTKQRGQDSTQTSNFYQGVFFTGAGSVANILFLFLETMIAVRLLKPDSYGIYILLVAVVNFFIMLMDFGSMTAVTQMIASSDRVRQAAVANSALVFRLLVIAVISTLIWLGQDLLSLLDPSRALLQYAVYVPLMLAVSSFDELLLGILQGFQAYHHMAIAQIVRSILRLGLVITFLVVLELGVVGLIYSWIISFAVSATYLFLAQPISKRFVYYRPLLGEMLRFGFPIQLNQVLRFVAVQVDVLLLGILAGPASVALYAVAARIPQALQRLSEAYITVFFPTMTTLLAKGQSAKAGWMLNHSLRLLSFASTMAALIAVLFSDQIVTILFSEQYTASSIAFALLMIALHMAIMTNLMGYTLTAAGYPGRSLVENSIRASLNFLANLILIPGLGFVGAAIARLIALFIGNPINIWLLRRSNISVAVASFFKQTALLLSCAALFWWFQPISFMFKVVIIGLFIVLNIGLSTISRDDLTLVLPKIATSRLGIRQEG